MKDSAAASFVVEHQVPQGKEAEFRAWHDQLMGQERQYPGYIRTDLYPPVEGIQLKWYSIIYFESAEAMDAWLQSSDRAQQIELGKQIFSSYQLKSFSTGLEGWFSQKSGMEEFGYTPPAWKQSLAVVCALYPTVMVLALLFNRFGIMKGWSLADAMLVNNILSTILLTWLIMPAVTRGLKFWLHPSRRSLSLKTDLLGIVLISVALGMMVIFFNHLSGR